MASAQLDAAIDLLTRLPPDSVVQNLTAILDLAPELTEELLTRVDQPLQVAQDTVAGKEFLLCDYNRDADSYRSPHSNEYFPPDDLGRKPSAALRELETVANELFSVYREQYYEGGLSSVYLWETGAASTSAEAAPGAAAALSPQTAFAGAFLVHKGEGSGRHGASLSAGLWDAVHVVEVLPGEGGSTSYNLSTTIALHLATNTGESGGAKPGGRFELAGSLGRASSSVAPTPGAATGHLLVLGRLVEEMENKLRGTLDSVYFGQTRSVVGHLRASDGEMSGERRASMQASIMADVLKSSSLGRPPGGPMGLPGGFDPRAALAGLKKTAKPAAAPEQ